MRGPIDSLELELRRIPGVMSVSFNTFGDNHVMRVLADGGVDTEDVRRQAHQLARSHLDMPITIEIDSNSMNGHSAETVSRAVTERVRLLAVRIDEEHEELEVHLSYGDHRTVGRGNSITLAGAAEATIAALDGLGARVPFQVKQATSLGSSLSDAVVVVLRSTEPGNERMGIAGGKDDEEATARATLDALNRFLSDEAMFELS